MIILDDIIHKDNYILNTYFKYYLNIIIFNIL